jgi:hypothetical protein
MTGSKGKRLETDIEDGGWRGSDNRLDSFRFGFSENGSEAKSSDELSCRFALNKGFIENFGISGVNDFDGFESAV